MRAFFVPSSLRLFIVCGVISAAACEAEPESVLDPPAPAAGGALQGDAGSDASRVRGADASSGNTSGGSTSASVVGDRSDGGPDPRGPADSAPARQRSWPAEDWTTQGPEAQGMDSNLLDRARAYAFEESRNTQGVVVSRGGVIVAEWYADGSDAGSWAASWSVAKSFASALIGIAIDEGLIESVDLPMAQFIPSWAGTEKAEIRLRDVLQMATGLAWTESYDTTELLSPLSSDVVYLTFAGGQELEYAAGVPVANPPGVVFNYSSGNSMLLSAVIQTATGRSAAEYAREKLFAPLGIDRVDWWQSTEGHTLTFCCIDTTTRDFARFGLLYARGGRWHDKQLISPQWIADSLAPSPARAGYGYQWWLLGQWDQEGPPDRTPPTPSTLPPDTFAAIGVDDQLIYVVPHLDLVVVRNGLYRKYAGAAVADPNLLWCYPPMGLDPELGTLAPSSWSHKEFLQLILDSML